MRHFNDEQIEIIRNNAEYKIDLKLEEIGLIKKVYDGWEYLDKNIFSELQDKVKKLEELTGYKADDYEWKTTTREKLVKKEISK